MQVLLSLVKKRVKIMTKLLSENCEPGPDADIEDDMAEAVRDILFSSSYTSLMSEVAATDGRGSKARGGQGCKSGTTTHSFFILASFH